MSVMQFVLGLIALLLPSLASSVAVPADSLSVPLITATLPPHTLTRRATSTFDSLALDKPPQSCCDNSSSKDEHVSTSFENDQEVDTKASALKAVSNPRTAPSEAIQGGGDGGSEASARGWSGPVGGVHGAEREGSADAATSTTPSSKQRQHSLLTNTTGDAEEVVTPISDASNYIEKIFLWTRYYNSAVGYEVLDMNNIGTLVNSHFVISSPTIILVHGFLSNGLMDWIRDIKDKLIAIVDCNVISVQWSAGTSSVQYYTITTRVPYVGQGIAQLASLLHYLKQVRPDQMYLVGHSLGAHVAGFVGKKNILDPIGRITGLDPAGLTYDNTDGSVRLDKRDASYVDIIHTNGCVSANKWLDCFGISNSIGHTDFWPNGGKYQPACNAERQRRREGHDGRADKFVGCDHEMAYKYYAESLDYSDSTTLFLSRPRNTVSAAEQVNDSCGHFPQYMGYNADLLYGNGDYSLVTHDRPPYAVSDGSCPSRHSSVRLSTMTRWIIGIATTGFVAMLVLVPTATLLSRRLNGPGGDEQPILAGEQAQGREEEVVEEPRSLLVV